MKKYQRELEDFNGLSVFFMRSTNLDQTKEITRPYYLKIKYTFYEQEGRMVINDPDIEVYSCPTARFDLKDDLEFNNPEGFKELKEFVREEIVKDFYEAESREIEISEIA